MLQYCDALLIVVTNRAAHLLQRRLRQRRLLAKREALEQCCNHSYQCRINVATPWCANNRGCESSRVTALFVFAKREDSSTTKLIK